MLSADAAYLKTIAFLFSAAPKRTVTALARARDALLSGIHDLHELEKVHGLMSIASDFTEKNKDILSKLSTEGSQIPDSRNAPVTPATDGNVPPTSVAPSGHGTPIANAGVASALDVPNGHGTPTANAGTASALDTTDVTCPTSGARASPIGSIRPPDAEHEARVQLGGTHSGGDPWPMITKQDGSDQKKCNEPEDGRDSGSTKQDGSDQEKKRDEPEEDGHDGTGHNPEKRGKSKSKSDNSSSDDNSSDGDDSDNDSSMKTRKRKRSAKKSRGQCMFLICAFIPSFKSDYFRS
jgi:hypothetical protein